MEIIKMQTDPSGETKLKLTFSLMGEQRLFTNGGIFESRAIACKYVRKAVFDWYIFNLEKYFRNCAHFQALEGRKPDADKLLKFINFYSGRPLNDPKYLNGIIYLYSDLRNQLPTSKRYEKQKVKLADWLKTFDLTARDFYDEWANKPELEMKHLIQAK